MMYRNIKTGAKITSPCAISGKDWIEVKPEEKKETKKKATKKD